VGDDWQAINGFAGSELTFYNNFTFNIENSERVHMLTNHRSDGKIVGAGNALMKNYGSPANVANNKGEGKITLLSIDDIFVYPIGDKSKDDLPVESEFLIYYRPSNNNSTDICNFRASKYLKLCYLVCSSPENLGKSITILSRTERISGVSPRYFQKKLFEWIQSDDDEFVREQVSKIKISTIHSYKGLESDIVIIIEATDSMFPKIHPDNNLYNVFGRTAVDYLEEERRLFYVGITRAKSAIYFLTETKKVSQFIQTDLGLKFEHPKNVFPILNPNDEDTIVDEDDDSIPF
jgi:DNA helicase-4